MQPLAVSVLRLNFIIICFSRHSVVTEKAMCLLVLLPFVLGQSPPPGVTPPIDSLGFMAAVRKPYWSACKSFLRPVWCAYEFIVYCAELCNYLSHGSRHPSGIWQLRLSEVLANPSQYLLPTTTVVQILQRFHC